MNKTSSLNDKSFRLLCELLIAGDDERIKELLGETDETVFLGLLQQIRWHRLGPIIYRKINSHKRLLPEYFFNALNQLNTKIIKKNLTTINELIRFDRILNNQSINYIVLKGVALSQQLYGTSILRMSKDLDILIEQSDVLKVDAILKNLGFKQYSPRIQPHSAAFEKYMERQKEIVYYNEKSKVEIEIHWRLHLNHQTMPIDFEDLWSSHETIIFNNLQINVINHKLNFCYLISHGGISMWGRLVWLYDIYIYYQLIDNDQWQQYQQLINNWQLTRMENLAILLINYLFKKKSHPHQNTIKINWISKITFLLIKRNLLNREYPSLWTRTLARFLLKKKLNYKIGYLKIIINLLIHHERIYEND